MGACLSNEKLPDNIFVVRNIHDDNRKFPKGIIEVTQVELKYKDAQSGDEWVWPLKYLRKYGCDRDLFSIEAGRKCPGGEGLFAFSTKKASQLYDMVARNISEGGLEREEVGVLSPQDTSQGVSPPIMTSSNVISTVTPLSTAAQNSMSEGNFSFSSQHKGSNGVIPGRPHSNSSSAVLDPSGAPTRVYKNITMSWSTLQTIPEDSEIILHSPPAPHVQPNYMNIKQNSALGSSGGGCRGTDPVMYHRPRLGLMRHDSDAQATYQNLHVQPNYMNIKPNSALGSSGGGCRGTDPVLYHRPRLGLMRHDSDAQATYQNLQVGMGTASPPRVSDSSSYLSASLPRVSGPKMAVYALLDLSGPATSTPKGKGGDGKRSREDNENYMTLNFSGVAPPPNKTPEPMETSRTRYPPPPTQIQLPEVRRSSTEVSRPGAAAVIQDRPDNSMTVNYSTLNFDAIRALQLTREQRKQEIRERLEEEAREDERKKREEAENPGKKKKNKKKKKDRRNSHQ